MIASSLSYYCRCRHSVQIPLRTANRNSCGWDYTLLLSPNLPQALGCYCCLRHTSEANQLAVIGDVYLALQNCIVSIIDLIRRLHVDWYKANTSIYSITAHYLKVRNATLFTVNAVSSHVDIMSLGELRTWRDPAKLGSKNSILRGLFLFFPVKCSIHVF